MAGYLVESIDLTDTSRLLVHVDESPECPRGDWHMLTGFVKIDDRGDSRLRDVPAVHEPPIDIAGAHIQYDGSAWVPEEMTLRWARAFHGLVIEYDHEHGGYWFVAGADAATAQTPVDESNRALFYDNWPDLKIGTPEHLAKQAEVIAQEREAYRQWAEGEVYGVTLQRRVSWARVVRNESDDVWDLKNPLTDDDVRDDWEDVDSIWGCYLDGDYTAWVVADEYFDLTDDEEAVIRQHLPVRVTDPRAQATA